MSRRVCPHCGNTMFAAAMTMACIVETTEDENNPFKMMKKGDESKAEIKVMKCMRCKADVSNDDLLTGVVCKECGRVVMPDSLNEDGVCEVCRAKKERKELQNATPEELIAMLLEAEKRAAVTSATKKVEQAESAAAAVTEKAEEKKAEENEKPAKKAGKRGKAKASKVKSDVEEKPAPQEDKEVSKEEVSDAEQEIANSQEAPFPDTDALAEAINPPANEPEDINEEEPQPAPAPFSMFDDDEEQPF